MKLQKRILVAFFILMLILTVKCFAVSEGETVTYDGVTAIVPSTREIDENLLSSEEGLPEDGLYDRIVSTPSTLDSVGVDVSSMISTYETDDTVIGIDVSYYQGDIDWSAIASSGVKFAMIRVGYRGYGSSGTLVTDPKFEEYIQGAIDNGIYVGVYFFSTATTDEEALEEAAYVVNLIKNYNITYPVAYDFEYFGDNYDKDSGNPYRTNGLSNEQLNSNAKTFLGYIESQGYTACLYSSAYPLNSVWDSELKSSYDVWVAHYNTDTPAYSGSYSMWQYTSSGSVSGISTNVDIDIDYKYYAEINSTEIASYLFNATYYADRYSDLKKAYGYDETKLKEHWLNYGIKEGRTASPVFDIKYYLSSNSDLVKVYGSTGYESAYYHFIKYGIKEGRQGSKYFSVTYYVSNYNDINRTYGDDYVGILGHFVNYGISEGRIGSSDFNVITYYSSQSAYTKYQLGTEYLKYYALADGGNPINNDPVDITDYLFDSTYYADKYADLKRAYGYDETKLKEHWLNYGIKEGRSASSVFDIKYYLSNNADLIRAYGSTGYESAYYHFINYGINEGRQGSETFSVKAYLSNYTDLQTAYGTNYSKALVHYITYGQSEGRSGI